MKYDAFVNIVGKGENAGKHHFLLFSQCVLSKTEIIIQVTHTLLSAIALNLVQYKILPFQ